MRYVLQLVRDGLDCGIQSDRKNRLHEHCMCNMWPAEMVLMNLLEPRHGTVSLHAHTILKTNGNLKTSNQRISLFSSKLWPLLRITHLVFATT